MSFSQDHKIHNLLPLSVPTRTQRYLEHREGVLHFCQFIYIIELENAKPDHPST